MTATARIWGPAFGCAPAPSRKVWVVGGAMETYGSFRMRAVGGGSLEGSSLFRSGELSGIADAEAAVLAGLYGVELVCDLRNQWEIAEHPEPAIGRFCYVATLPSFERRRKDADRRLAAGVIGEYGRPEERMVRNYRGYAEGLPSLGRALRALASEGVPALVHCVNGKDRTGVLCAVAMTVAGFHRDDVMADYLAFNEVNADVIEAEAERLGAGMTAAEKKILLSFLEARPAYLLSFFDEACKVCGSFDCYVSDYLRLGHDQRDRLTALLGNR